MAKEELPGLRIDVRHGNPSASAVLAVLIAAINEATEPAIVIEEGGLTHEQSASELSARQWVDPAKTLVLYAPFVRLCQVLRLHFPQSYNDEEKESRQATHQVESTVAASPMVRMFSLDHDLPPDEDSSSA